MTENTKKDPRCPVCGNAVLQGGVVGNEGTYHLLCTSPPIQFVPAPQPVFVPTYIQVPRPWWENVPTWICESTNQVAGVTCRNGESTYSVN